MKEAPERIWAFNAKQTGYRFYANGPQPEFDNVEYIRADLAALDTPAPALMDELVEAHRENARVLSHLHNDLQGRVDVAKLAALFECLARSTAALSVPAARK